MEGKDQDTGDYWMRTAPADRCAQFSTAPDERTGIIRYNPSSTALPTLDRPALSNKTCDDVNTDLLNPIVPWCVDQHPRNNVTEDTYEAGLQTIDDTSLGPPGHPYKHWFLGERPMWLNFSRPTILYIDESLNNPNYTVTEGSTFPASRSYYSAMVLLIHYHTEDYSFGFIYLILHSPLSIPV